jgi:hypothetical protein
MRLHTKMRLLRQTVYASLFGVLLCLNACVRGPAGDTNSARRAEEAKTERKTLADYIPPCGGNSARAGESLAATAKQHAHSVTLSWNAAVPKSKSAGDAIKGYYVYRSSHPHNFGEQNRISALLSATNCIDTTVAPGKTYFYTVKAISGGGKQSAASQEIKAVVPFP